MRARSLVALGTQWRPPRHPARPAQPPALAPASSSPRSRQSSGRAPASAAGQHEDLGALPLNPGRELESLASRRLTTSPGSPLYRASAPPATAALGRTLSLDASKVTAGGERRDRATLLLPLPCRWDPLGRQPGPAAPSFAAAETDKRAASAPPPPPPGHPPAPAPAAPLSSQSGTERPAASGVARSLERLGSGALERRSLGHSTTLPTGAGARAHAGHDHAAAATWALLPALAPAHQARRTQPAAPPHTPGGRLPAGRAASLLEPGSPSARVGSVPDAYRIASDKPHKFEVQWCVRRPPAPGSLQQLPAAAACSRHSSLRPAARPARCIPPPPPGPNPAPPRRLQVAQGGQQRPER